MDQPSVARVYDYYLGGFHNFAADREMGRRAVEIWPELPMIMQANRAFLRRVVRYLVGTGVTQFLDLGSGIPTAGNVHEVAQQATAGARVVYVDNDPVAVAHSRSILGADPGAVVIQADMRDPEAVLADPVLCRTLDLGQPVAILMVALLHFVSDDRDPAGLVARFGEAAAPGSHLVVSHATADRDPERAAQLRELYRRTPSPMTMRSAAEVTALMGGFDLVAPGVVYLPQWRPDPEEPVQVDPSRFSGFAAVGRKG
jgi:hypothetical protein